MKRAHLQIVAAWHYLKVFAAEIHAHNALQAVTDADEELDRAGGWLQVKATALRAAKAQQYNAQFALRRHQRHRDLGIQ